MTYTKTNKHQFYLDCAAVARTLTDDQLNHRARRNPMCIIQEQVPAPGNLTDQDVAEAVAKAIRTERGRRLSPDNKNLSSLKGDRTMASKTQMFQLLRLIDQGAHNDDVITAAWSAWPQLPEQTQTDMRTNGRRADAARARIWSAAWDGGMEHVLDGMEDYSSPTEVSDLRATIHDYTEALDECIYCNDTLAADLTTLIADVRLAIHNLRNGYTVDTIQDLEAAAGRAEQARDRLELKTLGTEEDPA